MANQYIFIDDAGDPGLKIKPGSSSRFAIACVCFSDNSSAAQASKAIDQLRDKLHPRSPSHEFKFRKSNNRIKLEFFQTIQPLDFVAHVTLIDKRNISGAHLIKHPDTFYYQVILSTLRNYRLKQAKIYIDGDIDGNHRQKIRTLFRKSLPTSAISKLTFRNSKSDNLIQLADMIAGASYQSSIKPIASECLEYIRSHLSIHHSLD